MKTLSALTLLFLISAHALWPDRSEGVMLHFRKQEERLISTSKSPEYFQTILHRNLVNAVRAIIQRRLYDQKEAYFKDLSIKNIAYENPTSNRVFFVRFKDFVARLSYELSPEIHVHYPKSIRFIRIPQQKKSQPALGTKP